MDAVIVAADGQAECRKLRDVKAGEPVVCGHDGIRVTPEFRERDRLGFAFMSNDVSSERRVEGSVARIAADDARREESRRPHRRGRRPGRRAHRRRRAFLGADPAAATSTSCSPGNALAVHDIEFALSGTSLGIDLVAGAPVEQGHRNHMAAINTINRAGSIRAAVEQRRPDVGRHVRVREARRRVRARRQHPRRRPAAGHGDGSRRGAGALRGGAGDNVQMVLMLSSMLHSIGVGNMLPSWVRVVCVDINPAVVTKLSDRGSSQTVGVVTDVGLFLHRLAEALQLSDRPIRTIPFTLHGPRGRRLSIRHCLMIVNACSMPRAFAADPDTHARPGLLVADGKLRGGVQDDAARAHMSGERFGRPARRQLQPDMRTRRMRLHALPFERRRAIAWRAVIRAASSRRCAPRCRPRSSRSANPHRSATP